jgi:hypothetical protein
MRRAAWFLILGGLAGALSAQSALPGTEPVPPGLLQGSLLTLERWNCSVETPAGDGWAWLKVNVPVGKLQAASYICYNAESDARYILQMTESSEGEMSDKFADNFLAGMRRGIEKKGGKLTDIRRQPSERPLRGSFRISANLSDESGRSLALLCYLAGAGNAYIFQTYARSEEEPATFTRFVSSFRLLKPVPKGATSSADAVSGVLTVFGILIVLACAGVAGLVNRAAGRPRVNGAVIGGVLVMLGAITLMVLVAMSPSFANRDAEQQGEAMGRVLGMALIPMLVAFFLGWRFQKKKKAALARSLRLP